MIDQLSGSKQNTTWADSGLVMSSEHLADQQNDLRIGGGITSEFDEDRGTNTHTHTYL